MYTYGTELCVLCIESGGDIGRRVPPPSIRCQTCPILSLTSIRAVLTPLLPPDADF